MANEHVISNDTQISGSLNVSQSITAAAYYGDGSNLLYVTASSQWNGVLTGSANITGSLTVKGGEVDLLLASGVSGSFSGSFEGNGAGLTGINLNGYQASGSILSGSFSGSFQGDGSNLTGITASFYSGSITNSVSSSYAATASYWSGSIASSSYAINAQNAATASYWTGSLISAQTASYVNPLTQDIQVTGSVSISGSQINSSTVQVAGKIQSETGIDVLAPNGISFKNAPFNTTALGAVNYSNGIAFYSNGLITPRMFISESGNIGVATTNPALAKLQVAGNIYATSFTGSLSGTASYASQALSASFATTASYSRTATSASLATTASYYNTSLLTPLSTFNTFTGSYNTGSYSGSFTGILSGDGSGITGVTSEWDGTRSGSAEITGSLAVSDTVTAGSFVGDGSGITGIVSPTAITASYALTASYVDQSNNALTASLATTAINATSASIAVNASQAVSSSYATSASYALNTVSASYSNNAATASYITGTAATAISASHAIYADIAESANSASYAANVESASYASIAGYATSIDVTDQITGTGPYYPLFTDGTIDNTVFIDSSLYTYNATTNTLTVTASNATSASYAVSASWAPSIVTDPFPYTGSAIISGSLNVIDDLTIGSQLIVGTFTGSQNPTIYSKTSNASENILLESSDTSTSSAPDLVLYRNAGIPDNGDTLGVIEFKTNNNSGGSPFVWNGIYSRVVTGSLQQSTLTITAFYGASTATVAGFHSTGSGAGAMIVNAPDAFTIPQATLDVRGTGRFTNNVSITGSLMVSGGAVDIGTGTSYPYDYKLKVDSGTDTFGIVALGSGAQFTGLGIGNTTSGRAELYLDASNGDFSGNDYAWIAQNDDLSLELTTGPSSNGSIQLKPNDQTALELFSNGNAAFSGSVTIGDILTLPVRTTTPGSPTEGMIIASGSAGSSVLYYYNGTSWNALF